MRLTQYTWLLLLVLTYTASAQNQACLPPVPPGTSGFTTTVFFNYGGQSNAIGPKNRNTFTVGEPVIGAFFGRDTSGALGFYSRYLLPPFAPVVFASEGDLTDRIQVEWVPNLLSPFAEAGFNIYRDGAFIASVDKNVRVYVDFNVQAGVFYNYQVAGRNEFGEGIRGSGLGFLNPNGVVTGQVRTLNGNPVPDASITLTPTLGTALTFDGDDGAFTEFDSSFWASRWTFSCWVRIDNGNNRSMIADFGSTSNKNWWLTTGASGAKGVRFFIGQGTGADSISATFASNPDGWHQVAATYTGTSLLLYVDGELAATKSMTLVRDTLPIYFGRNQAFPAARLFSGELDDVRLFRRQLSQTEISMFKNRTVNSDADSLSAYWKFDEGVGSKAYDISANRHIIYLCGPQWTDDRPNVVNGAITDAAGYYKIEGINYGGGETFTAVPEKNGYESYALEFNNANGHYALLPDSILLGAQQTTIELLIKNLEPDAPVRTLLANQSANGATNFFQLAVEGGNLKLTLGGEEKAFGAMGTGYQHLVFTLNSLSNTVTLYKNGGAGITRSFAAPGQNFAAQQWTLGAGRMVGGYNRFFTGLIDEVAFYDTILSQAEAQLNANVGVNPTHPHLRSYFPLNESRDNLLEDIGPGRTGFGLVSGALWSTLSARPNPTPHEFQPPIQLVTLNPSNTSTDKVDFTDLSTVPVSGFVRYDGTNCFAEGAEILVNGQSANPPIFTDADGKFVADFEPGATAVLSARLGNHVFTPASWQVRNLNAPVAGILFRDMTKRSISLTVAGGTCKNKYGIVGPNETMVLKVSDPGSNPCYEQTIEVVGDADGGDKRVTFTNLPPRPLNVSVLSHTNFDIKDYFDNVVGGETVDLTDKNDTLAFIYIAPPQIEVVEDLEITACSTDTFFMIEQLEYYTMKFKVFQEYAGGNCNLDTAFFSFDNQLSADPAMFDTVMTAGTLGYRFQAGQPNLASPYTLNLTVTAMQFDSQQVVLNRNAVILGQKSTGTTFASTTPEIPFVILRDPPGDASSATIEKGTTFCNAYSFGVSASGGGGETYSVKLGTTTEVVTGIGVANINSVVIENTTSKTWSATFGASREETSEICLTANEVISTNGADDLMGKDANIFVGGALNLFYGVTNNLTFNDTICSFEIEKGVIISPIGVPTTFVYQRHDIINTVIPNLEALLPDPDAQASIDRWLEILALDDQLEQEAVFEENISFTGGVTVEKSQTTDRSDGYTYSFETEVGFTFANELDLQLNGTGGGYSMEISITAGASGSIDENNSSSVTTSYVLNDDDIGDLFSVNVKRDKRYGTPVFDLLGGETSCPWEAPTQKRNAVAFSATSTSAVNIGSNAAAVFNLTLGNESETDEDRTYTLSIGSNPLGALVKAEGQQLTAVNSLEFDVPAGQSMPLKLTVERGPLSYSYQDIEIIFSASCEDGSVTEFSKSLFLDVEFVEPCSEVDIAQPMQNDVINAQSGNTVSVGLVDYDVNDPDLSFIRVQYRPKFGDGSWFNIQPESVVLKADLNPVSTSIPWDVSTLDDGPYELRALTNCTGGNQEQGISTIINLRVEREAPKLLGVPQPADGIWSRDDEISITFNEEINCDVILQASIGFSNNIGLYDVATGDLIDFTFSCFENKIVLVPSVANRFLEGKILRAEVHDIEDLVGNTFSTRSWTFFVNRSPIDLEGGDMFVTLYEGEGKTELRQLLNVGGSVEAFQIDGVPDWLSVFPNVGTLLPGEEVTLSFVFDNTLPQGLYTDTLFFRNGQGDERLIVNARVLCDPPEWTVAPAGFSTSMNFTVKLNIEGDLSTDEADLVAAFIDGELRGVAPVRYLPSLDTFMAFLTVYGETGDNGKPIDLEIWDASACLRYGEVVEQFDFLIDDVIGSLGNPQVLNTNSNIRRDIPLVNGWNWISFNLDFPDPALDAALGSLAHPQNDLIKTQGDYAEYLSAGNTWVGDLAELDNTRLFQYRADQPDTIRMSGALIDPATVQIPINTDWNWIGYVPNYALPVSQALAGLTPLNGDIIKGQTAFAQYLAGYGWLGSLQFLEAPKGYQLRISNPGTLTYPAANVHNPAVVQTRGDQSASFWNINPAQYEHTMTLTGAFSANGQNATESAFELGAFVGNELRGSAQALYVQPLGVHLYFLTMYANAAGEQVTFRQYDAATGEIMPLSEQLFFTPNQHVGSAVEPYLFTAASSSTGSAAAPDLYLNVQPNPFESDATIRFHSLRSQEVALSVTDALGRQVLRENVQAAAGDNAYVWHAHGLSAGLYLIRLETADGSAVQQVVKR